MSLLRHKKENLFIKKIFEVLDSKYNGNINYYKKAEMEVNEYYKLIKKIKKANTIQSNYNSTNNENFKFTHLNLKNNLLDIQHSNYFEPILAKNIDYLSIQKSLPCTIDKFLNDSKNYDLSKAKNHDERSKALSVFNWVKTRMEYNITLQNCSVNKQSGILNYATTVRDPSFGTCTQNINIYIDKDKYDSILGVDNKRSKILSLSQDYETLFRYYLLFGFNEIYARCSCNEYNQKYGKKKGNANYFCSHLLYSMCQLPYYAFYLLK